MFSPTARAPAREPGGQDRSYSAGLIDALLACALLLAVLPIPVTAFRLLPVYQVHARFLIFYTPLVCLLLLAYLFYVRDSLGRWMFAKILYPLPDFDPYSGSSTRRTAAGLFRGFRIALLAVLPIVLLALSFYCFRRYTARLTESVEIAAVTWAQSLRVQPAIDTVPEQKPRKNGPAGTVGESPPDSASMLDSLALRREVLQYTRLDSIPLFTELTIWYIGIFATALMAVLLMALKENAKEAMGLSEQDIIVGGPGEAEGLREYP